MEISIEEANGVKATMVRYLARSGYGKYRRPTAEEIFQSEQTYAKMKFSDLFEEYVEEYVREVDAERGPY